MITHAEDIHCRYFIDVSPLMEMSWTGIANVTSHLAQEMYRRFPHETVFFFAEKVLDPKFVLNACAAPGGYLKVMISNGYGDLGHISSYLYSKKQNVGIFPNIKRSHKVFDCEVVIFYDLSAMLMPELHQGWAADEHAKAMMEDSASSDLICCISEATRMDVEIYLPQARGKTFVSPLGVSPLPDKEREKRLPYVLVLGTIEPRKNLALVADYMASRPDLAESLAFIFVGRSGWGSSFETVFNRVLKHPGWKNRVSFAGHLDEGMKWALLRQARFALFPSLFEGFGLPVLEAMAAGCPIAVSRSSSLVEFELDPSLYFDPFSVSEFSKSFRFLETRTEAEREHIGSRLKAQSEQYTWVAFVDRLLTAISTQLMR